ncbi:MAG TPA: DUF4236 domain-containing protein [Candidatus Binataceae bacterium]|nr:DUF4236 domain-containing protein [Candidatus Binataceae bacterium]
MPFRFYRRVHVLPGVSINVSKSGPSLSVGMRGAHLTLGRNGVSRTVGIPGTGIYYTSRAGTHTGAHYHGGSGAGIGWMIAAVVIAALALLTHSHSGR